MSQTIQKPSNQSNPRISGSTSEGLKDHDGDFSQMCDTVCTALKCYGIQHPAILTSVVFMAGFYIGWKTKPW
jgi:hypothetical protein